MSFASRLQRLTPRAILVGALVAFLLYCWPGFVGWDTREHLLQSRMGIYTDGHPPAIARLWRVVELVIAGPAGMLLIQAVTLLVGLFLLFKSRVTPRAAAIAASAIFLFPFVSGVTALICKDALMAGFLMIGIALLLDPRKQWLALGFILLASLMRWNALAATFAPVILLFRPRPSLVGWRRYAAALGVWAGLTGVGLEANELLTTTPEYMWYRMHAIQDIGGTLEYVDELDDPALSQMLDGVSLRVHDHLHERIRAAYNPADFRQFTLVAGHIIDEPRTEAERDGVVAAWERVVLGHPLAYLHYRWDNFQLLVRLVRPPAMSGVYVWFSVIAAPQTIPELEHDANQSRLQSVLRAASIWISLSPLYFTFIYFGACFVLLAVCRRRLETAVLLSAIGYELAWFFLAPTTDVRYSQWMVMCSLIALTLWLLGRTRVALPAATTADCPPSL